MPAMAYKYHFSSMKIGQALGKKPTGESHSGILFRS
jgi:hypothetical protein